MKWLVIVPALLLIMACDGETNPLPDQESIPDQDVICREGDELCSSSSKKVVCTGTSWAENETCNPGTKTYCYTVWNTATGHYEARCSTTEPTEPQCREGETLCIFNELRECVDGVLESLRNCYYYYPVRNAERCEMSFNSDTYTASCVKVPCNPGDRKCGIGDEIYRCNDQGEWDFDKKCEASYPMACYDYQDEEGLWYAYCEGVDEKPNIYLYPTAPLDITVRIGFPQGGRVTVSEPLYDDGWTVRVTPDGMIDGQWRFLFYESVQPNGWQRERGHLVATDEMEPFFRNDLAARGFIGQEIEDFIEWWMPLLAEPGYLIVYPQDDAVIRTLETLELSVTPDSLLRHRYVIETTAEPVTVEPPDAPAPFSRDGFTVTEWGVIRLQP